MGTRRRQRVNRPCRRAGRALYVYRAAARRAVALARQISPAVGVQPLVLGGLLVVCVAWRYLRGHLTVVYIFHGISAIFFQKLGLAESANQQIVAFPERCLWCGEL